MFSYKSNVSTYNFNDIKIGGELGKHPTVLVGSMFYTGHKIVEDRSQGIFDRKKAEILINQQEELSDKTGIPGMIDIVAVRPNEFESYIDFVVSVTDMPFLVDAWQENTKLAAARIIHERGLQNRVIYNSLSVWSKDIENEVQQLSNLDIKNAILVAYNPENVTINGRTSIIKDFLIPYAEKSGFKQILIDTSVINAPSTAISILTGRKIRDELGFPVGCGPSNGTDPKAWSIPRKSWGKHEFIGADASIHAITALWNDFILYGPIENAKWIFPAISLAEMIKATFRAELTHNLPESNNHPLMMYFSEFIKQLKESFDDEF